MRIVLVSLLLAGIAGSAGGRPIPQPPRAILLLPDAVFDGETRHSGWAVLVRGANALTPRVRRRTTVANSPV